MRHVCPLAGLAVVLAAVPAVATPRPPEVDSTQFAGGAIDNPWFPLIPGTTFFYDGDDEGVAATEAMAVTHATKEILGVTCTVVHDQVFKEGYLAEDTFDWYAQDLAGNVWYFGEDTRELDADGNVLSTEGTWEAGVDDARAGLAMEAEPAVGDRYYEELARNVGEDQAKVVALDGLTCVPYGCFADLQVTEERTRIEPGIVERKYYAEGVGFIRSDLIKGGNEVFVLVDVTTE